MPEFLPAKPFVGLAILLFFLFRFPFQLQCRKVPKVLRKLTELNDIPLTIAKVGLLLPIVWVLTSHLNFADYRQIQGALISGLLFFVPALWLIQRSHADLGANWSITLETRENHQLVSQGVYQKVRHPMYLSMLLFSVGLAIAVPNYIAGPSMFISMVALIALRVGAEEQMMLEAFGEEYEVYRQRSSRLIPGVW